MLILAIIIFSWLIIGFAITVRELKRGVYVMPNHPIIQVAMYIGGSIVNPLFAPVVLLEMIDKRRHAH